MPTIRRIGVEVSAPGQVRAVPTSAGKEVTALGITVAALGDRLEGARQSREVNETVTEVTRRVLEHEDSLKERPDEFTTWTTQHGEFLNTVRDELVSTIEDRTVQDEVAQRFNTLQLSSQVRVRQGARGKEIAEGRASLAAMEDVLSDNYAKMRADVDRSLILDSIEDSFDEAADNGLIAPEEAVQRKQAFIHKAERLRALVDVDEDPEAALVELEQGTYQLKPGDDLVIKGKAERDIASNLAAAKATVAARQQATWTQLYDGIITDNAGRADIEQAHSTIDPVTGQRGLSEQGMRALLGQLDRHNKDKSKEATRRLTYQTAMHNGVPLDHKTKADREAAEQAFLDIASTLPDMEPREANATLINNVLRPLKVWPKSLQQQMRVASKASDVELITNFADLYDRVSTDPTVSAINISMSEQDQAFWESIASLRRAGVMTQDSIELTQHNVYELTDDDRKALNQVYKDKKYVSGNKLAFTEFLQKFDPTIDELLKFPDTRWSALFEGAPEAPPGMVADYQNLVRQFYMLTSDIEVARKLAGENLERAWIDIEVDD